MEISPQPGNLRIRVSFVFVVVCITAYFVFITINGLNGVSVLVKSNRPQNGTDVRSLDGGFYDRIVPICVVSLASSLFSSTCGCISAYSLFIGNFYAFTTQLYFTFVGVISFIIAWIQFALKNAYDGAPDEIYAVYDSFDASFMQFVRFQIGGFMIANFTFGAAAVVLFVGMLVKYYYI